MCYDIKFLPQLNFLTYTSPPQENFITPAVFGEIIYENFLFDIPKILDLCVLFGKGNSQLLHKMIGELHVKVQRWSSYGIVMKNILIR